VPCVVLLQLLSLRPLLLSETREERFERLNGLSWQLRAYRIA
jgi:hypothetical protein